MLSRTMTVEQDSSVTGGMSITGCLNDFSLYVFHPYGGGRKVNNLSTFNICDEVTWYFMQHKAYKALSDKPNTTNAYGTIHKGRPH